MQPAKHSRLTPKQKKKLNKMYAKWYYKIEKKIARRYRRGKGRFVLTIPRNPVSRHPKHNIERIEELASKYQYEINDAYIGEKRGKYWFSQIFLICNL